MTFLLDVNLLIALFDPHHVHHSSGHQWFTRQGVHSWATCPMTQTGFVRIVGNPSYPNSAGSPAAALELLRERAATGNHRFWPDDINLLNEGAWRHSERIAPAQVSDCYLVALAAHHGGKLVTFDRRIPADLLHRGRESLHILSS